VAKFSYNVETAQIELSDGDGNRISIGYIEEIALFPQKSKQAVAALNAVLELVAGKIRDSQFAPLAVPNDSATKPSQLK